MKGSAIFRRFAVNKPEFVLLVAAACLCLGIFAFLAIADEMSEGDFQHFEEHLLISLRDPNNLSQPIGPAWVRTWCLELTAIGSGPVLALMVLLVTGYFVVAGKYGSAFFILAASVTGALLSGLLKHLYDRERPSVVPHLAEVASGSFPSGHSMASSIIYLTLGAVLAQAATRWRERLYFIAAAFALSGLVGLTRVYLGVHYPSDVLGGWAAGTSWALVCWMIAFWLRQRLATVA